MASLLCSRSLWAVLLTATALIGSAWADEGIGWATGTSTIEGKVEQAPAESPKTPAATHQQTTVIDPASGGKLAAFCVDREGRILALINPHQVTARTPGQSVIHIVAKLLSKKKTDTTADNKPAEPEQPTAVTELCILDADGKLLEAIPLDFDGQAVNVAPDGSIYIAGDGVIVHLDSTGKELARAESPQVSEVREDPEALKRRARESLEQQRESIKETLKMLEQQKEALAKKSDSELTDDERQMKANMDHTLAAYKKMADEHAKPITDEQVAQTAEGIAKQSRSISSIAANDKYVFTTTRASKGYGFRVWRTKLDLTEPTSIVDGLSGCCGQMDVQCCGDEFAVAENSRKRIVRYDAEGKQVDSWGKGSRDGEGDTFGSCCNPMNTRFAGGKLYLSDSDGRVRLFSLDGKYEGEVGKAGVAPGCKSSIVDVSPDGERVYYIDVQKSKICVLQRQAVDHQAAAQIQ